MRWILLAILALSTALPAQSSSQSSQDEKQQPSLAELAKAARERKQKAAGGTRVITNSDLKSMRANVSTGTIPTPATSDTEDVSEEAGEGTEGEEALPSAAPGELTEEDLARWREAFGEARENLQNAVSENLVLQLRMNNLRNAYLRQADGSTQERIQAQLEETVQALEQNKQEQENARRAISRLQTDARQSGLTNQQIDELTGQLPEPPPDVLSPESTSGS